MVMRESLSWDRGGEERRTTKFVLNTESSSSADVIVDVV